MAGPIELRNGASVADLSAYIHALEEAKGWLDVDLVHTCFRMGEEVGELFKAVRRFEGLGVSTDDPAHAQGREAARAAVAEELVDVLNYLLAIANRAEVDLEAAFREKNERNQRRTWG